MTAIVVDASVAVAWRLREDEGALYADAVIHKLADNNGIVPSVFWAEIVNVLIVAERRARIDAADAKRHLGQLARIFHQFPEFRARDAVIRRVLPSGGIA